MKRDVNNNIFQWYTMICCLNDFAYVAYKKRSDKQTIEYLLI